MKMVRKQVYITQAQDEKLKQLAESSDVTEAEVIRRGIESMQLSGDAAENRVSRRTREVAQAYRSGSTDLPWSRADTYRGQPRRLDDDAWEEELAFIEERARALPEGGSTLKWRREDSYDERRSRLSR
jgi:hypothetical protein